MARTYYNSAQNGTREIIAAPGTGKKLVILGLTLNGSAADGTATFKSASTQVSGIYSIDITGQATLVWPVVSDPSDAWWVCSEDEAFNVTLSTNMDGDGDVVYRTVDA